MVRPIYVPQAGRFVNFSSTASDDDIKSYIRANFPKPQPVAPAAPAAAPQAGPDESGLFGRFAYGLGTGITDVPGGIAALLYPAEEAAKTSAGQFSEEARKYLEETFGIDPTKDPTTAQQAAEILGSAASFLVPGGAAAKGAALLGKGAALAGRGATLAGRVGTATAAAQGVAIGAESRAQTIQQQLASGMDISPEQQLASQRLSGLIGASEALPMGKFFEPIATILSKVPVSKAGIVERIVQSRLASITKAGAQEAAQEVASGIANDLMEYGVYNPDVEIGQDIISNAAGGAFAGSVLEGVIQLAAGRKLRGARQLQADIEKEKQENSADLRRANIALAADELGKAGAEGKLSVEQNESPDGNIRHTIMGTTGKPLVDLYSAEDAVEAINLYKQRTGAEVEATVKVAPELEPVRVAGRAFPTIEAAAEEHSKLKKSVENLERWVSSPEEIANIAAERKIPAPNLMKQYKDTLESQRKKLSMFDAYFSPEPVASEAETPPPGGVTMKTPAAAPTAEVPAPEAAAPVEAPTPEEPAVQPEVKEEYTKNFSKPEDIPEPVISEGDILEMPVGSVELPIEESRILPDTIVDNEFVPESGIEDAPVKIEKRPSANPEQLMELRKEMFGRAIDYRDMTPEQLAAYSAERDKRFPPEDVEIYASAGPLREPAPKTLREASITGPMVKDYSPETQAWIKNVYTQLQSRLQSIVPSEVTLNFKTLIDSDGSFLVRGQAYVLDEANGLKSIVDLSTGILEPGMSVEDAVKKLADTLNHEIIHVLRDKGLIRPAEWSILTRAVKNTNVPGKKYTYFDKAEAVYTPGGNPISKTYENPEAVIEEAVAEMYREWVVNRNKPKEQNAVGILNRIAEFFRRIFQTLRNARHEEVFAKIAKGEVGRRTDGVPRKSGERFSVSPTFLRDDPAYTEELQPGSKRKEYFIPEKMPASAAPKAFKRLNEAAAMFPNPLLNDAAWIKNMSFALNQNNGVLFPPGWAIAMSNDVNSWSTWMKGLTPDQLRGVDSGFASIDAISQEYKKGTATPEFTSTLLFWTYLSRMASSFPHESGFLDAAEGAQPFISKAIKGKFTADPDLLAMTATGSSAKALKKAAGFPDGALPADVAVPGRSDLDDWFIFVSKAIPSYSPGNSVTNNMNSYGRDFLYNMSAPSPDGGMSKLQAVHNLFSSNLSGPEIRREFHRIRDEANLGFDNKILSFAILLSGRQDVLILDRIQINQLFGGGQTNKIYDDVAGMFNGPKGLAVYEALERGLGAKVAQLYSQVGRPKDGTLGRYHWESWIRSSGQIVAHPTIQALVNLAQNKPSPFADIGSAEGRYHRSMFGVQYFKRAGGGTEFVYTTSDGREYSVAKNVLDTVLSKDNLLRIGAIPKWFPGVSDFEGGVVSWKDYPGVDITKVDAEIANNGRLITNGRGNKASNTLAGQNSAADAARIARARTAYDAANRIRWEFGKRPAGGKPTDRIPEPYRRTDRVPASGDVVSIYAPKEGVVSILSEAGVSHPEFNELAQTKKNAQRFADAITTAKSTNEHGAAVYVYDVNDYKNMRMFLTHDGKAGFAIKPDGDIVSVFNQKDSPHRGMSIPAVQLAIQLGGRKLDGFDTVLPNLYSQAGMSVVARTKFADLEGIRPSGWDYNKFANFNTGKPDVVFMTFDPGNWSMYKPTDGQLFTSNNPDPFAAAEEAYNSAVDAQSKAIFSKPEEVSTTNKRFSAAPVNPQEFQKWFKNSKAVNPDGTPQRWFHGTPFSFKQFGKGRSGAIQGDEGPFFFSQNPAFTEDYSLRRNYAGGDRGNVESGGRTIPVYLSVQNPFDYENPQHVSSVVEKLREMHENGRYPIVDMSVRGSSESLGNRLETLGYDLEDGDWPTIEKENVQKAIRELGFDGFFVKENKERNLAVYKPEQAKSIFNRFEEGAATSPRFSAAPLPQYVQQQNQNLFAPAPKIGFRDMLFNYVFGHSNTGKTVRVNGVDVPISKTTMAAVAGKAAAVDNAAYLTELEKIANQQATGNYQRMQADYSATAAIAWLRRSSHIMASMMLRGNLSLNYQNPGDILSATMKVTDDTDNLKSIFKIMTEPGPDGPNGEKQTKADIFKTYAVAKRGEWLRATGQTVPRELTPQYIAQTIPFVEREYPEVVEAYKMYQRFNKKLMTTVRDAGLISTAELGRLTNQMNYYGFIHEVYGEPLGPAAGQKAASRFKLRPYTGSQHGGLVNDPMFVMIQNAQFLVTSVAKNLAATKSFELAKSMGEARILQTDEKPDELNGEQPDTMFFSRNGTVHRFAVKDPLLVSALGSDDRVNVGKFWEVLGLPSHILRESVTRDPGFMARNLLRDTLSSWITSGTDFVPVIDTLKNFVKGVKGGGSFNELSARGVVGSYDLAMQTPEQLSATFRRNNMPLNVHTITSTEGGIAAIRSLWNRLGHVSEASDAATRMAVYDACIKNGMSEAEAAMQAIELLDFTRRGGSQTLGILTKLIPFLNARIQGMDVLYQAGRSGFRYATGRTLGERDANIGKKFLIRGGMLAALSVALELLNQDDEDYKQLDDYIKNSNLLIPLKEFGLKGQFIAFPKPFEAGLLFSTIPQQMVKTMNGDASTRENASLFWGQLASTFGVNPIPQALLPPIEIITNHNFFTGLPLISEGKARLAPELQYNTSTSQLAMMIGGLPIFYDFNTGKFGGASPIKIDKIISGYGGPVGSYLAQAVSLGMQDASIGPERMPIELSNAPVVKSFFIDTKTKNPKVVTQAYELFRIADEANRTVSRLKQMQDAEALTAYIDENREILRNKKYIFTLADRLNKLSAQERAIERDSGMTADEKIAAQQKLRDIRIRLASKVDEINQRLGR